MQWARPRLGFPGLCKSPVPGVEQVTCAQMLDDSWKWEQPGLPPAGDSVIIIPELAEEEQTVSPEGVLT